MKDAFNLRRLGALAGGPWTPAWDFRAGMACLAAGLTISLLSAVLLLGSTSLRLPGLSVDIPPTVSDAAIYNFESGDAGWSVRGAFTNPVVTDALAFAGHNSLEVQAVHVTRRHQGFIYVTYLPATRDAPRAGVAVRAHLYLPAHAPPLIAALYALDGRWRWYSGSFTLAHGGRWNTLRMRLRGARTPVRELGIIVVGSRHTPAYSGPLFLDSVNLR